MTEQPSLGQLIWLVRRDLEWAREADVESALRFGVKSVELDVTVEVTGTASGGGGLNLKVLGVGGSIDGSGTRSQSSGSHVHVVLTARDEFGLEYEVAATDTEQASGLPRRSASLAAEGHTSTSLESSEVQRGGE